jgi:anti-sigma factor ChrR (cupin superfamily)
MAARGVSVRREKSGENSVPILARTASVSPAVDPAAVPQLDPAPPYARLDFPNLFRIAERQDDIPWAPFKDGVDIHRLYGDGVTGPTAALLRFREAGKVPLHEHPGYEHIIVLAGSQRDQNSTATAGTLMINPPGSAHSVISEAGCIVLAIYQEPVQFVADSAVAPGPGEMSR